jgi:hypothetical protein
MKIEKTSTPQPRAGRAAGGSGGLPLVSLPAEALDDRIAIVGTAGSGKTYAAKGFVERLLERVAFPPIRTFDSSRTPKRDERPVIPRTLAEVDLTAIVAALAAAGVEDPRTQIEDHSRHARLEQELAAARARIAVLEEDNRELKSPACTDFGTRRGRRSRPRRRPRDPGPRGDQGAAVKNCENRSAAVG